MRGATLTGIFCSRFCVISIHAPHAGCDGSNFSELRKCFLFQSTHPMRGATDTQMVVEFYDVFQSTHPMRGATYKQYLLPPPMFTFQSTHPMRGATKKLKISIDILIISIHAPHAGCDIAFYKKYRAEIKISIHAPHAGCDCKFSKSSSSSSSISIHAPHAGCDRASTVSLYCPFDFNPRTPCGVRHLCCWSFLFSFLFQSTHPMRGATVVEVLDPSRPIISIHAPHAGCDKECTFPFASPIVFQSTHPMRGATRKSKCFW